MKNKLTLLAALLLAEFAALHAAGITPPEVWKDYDPDRGDFKEEIVAEEAKDGIRFRDTYISAYVLGEEIRVYCKYAVPVGATIAPGLMDVHGWMSRPGPDVSYAREGWAVMAHDYCGKTGDRTHYTKYPEKLRYGNMDGSVGYRVKARTPDGKDITDPRQTDDYLWYAIQRRVLSYLLSQKEVDKSRIGAKGYSYGGTLMWNLAMDPRVKAVVAYFGIGWLDYYRDRQVWMYKVPYAEPAKTPGEVLLLAAIAPEAHAPYIRAACLWLNGSNDHHGGHERGEQTFKRFQPGVPEFHLIPADPDRVESVEVYGTQPQTLILEADDRYSVEVEITASNDWQAIAVRPEQLRAKGDGHPLANWSRVTSIRLKPKAGSDITQVVFADIRWQMPALKSPRPEGETT